MGCDVVGGGRGGLGLGVAHLFKCGAKRCCNFAAIVEGGQFGLRGQGHDMLYDGREREDGSIIKIFMVLICEIKVPGGMTFAAHLR